MVLSRKGACPRLTTTIRDFCSNTGIHGLRYVGKEGTTKVEKLVWCVVCLGAATFSVYMCYTYYTKSKELPLLTSFDSTNAPLTSIPFPAFTVCNVNKFSKKKLSETITKNPKYQNVSGDLPLILKLMTIPELVRDDNSSRVPGLTQKLQDSQINVTDLLYIMKKTKVECHEIIVHCKWKGVDLNCSDLFIGRLTDDGYACTFNAKETKMFIPQINETYWEDFLGTWTTSTTTPNLPLRSARIRLSTDYGLNQEKVYRDSQTAGIFAGLTITLDGRTEDYSVTTSDFAGFKLLIHDPIEFPDVGERGFIIGLDSQVHVGIQCSVVKAREDVRTVSLSSRNCYVDGERQLEEFKSYSASNCILDCLTGHMMENISCRPYFYPVHVSHKICDFEQLPQLAELLRSRHVRNLCPECLPTCSNYIYDYRLSRAPFPAQDFFNTELAKKLRSHSNYLSMDNSTFEAYVKKNVVSLSLYYEESTCMAYRMEVRYHWDDFLASMGGILGLGMGFSAITVFECFYFFGIRPCLPKSLPQIPKQSPESFPSAPSADILFRHRRHRTYQIMPTPYPGPFKATPTAYFLQPVPLPIVTSIPMIPSWMTDPDGYYNEQK